MTGCVWHSWAVAGHFSAHFGTPEPGKYLGSEDTLHFYSMSRVGRIPVLRNIFRSAWSIVTNCYNGVDGCLILTKIVLCNIWTAPSLLKLPLQTTFSANKHCRSVFVASTRSPYQHTLLVGWWKLKTCRSSRKLAFSWAGFTLTTVNRLKAQLV